MEAVIGAMSTVIVALLGLVGVMWRQRNGKAHNPGNPGPLGHHDCQAEHLEPILERIDGKLNRLITIMAVIEERLPKGGRTL